MPSRKALMRVARAVLNTVLGKLNIEKMAIEAVAQAIIGGIVPQVEAGWEGPDMQRFVGEVNSRLAPELSSLGINVGEIATRTERAAQIIEEADQVARGKADGLADLFSAIY